MKHPDEQKIQQYLECAFEEALGDACGVWAPERAAQLVEGLMDANADQVQRAFELIAEDVNDAIVGGKIVV